MKQTDSTTENLLRTLPEPLLGWYRENARDLPWRHTEDPYRIWVSEIMLQQTRVAAVLGYYARFLAVFPTVAALAEADEELLMKLWEGLGYYSRARNLQRAAKEITALGGFPDTYDGLLALPGIGDYTASAIAAAAFGRREPAVDGNVLRVMTRLTDCHDDISDPKTKRAVRAALAEVMPEEPADIRIFNQAMMELGATVCGPNTAPRCDDCPVSGLCLGRQRGTAEILPVKKAKKERGPKSPAGWRRRRCSCWCGTERSPCGSGLKPACWRDFGSFPMWRALWMKQPPVRRWRPWACR